MCDFLFVYIASPVHFYAQTGCLQMKKAATSMHTGVTGNFFLKEKTPTCRHFMCSPASLSTIQTRFDQVSSPVALLNCQFSFILVGAYWESWEYSSPIQRALRGGTTRTRKARIRTCMFLLCFCCWQETSGCPSYMTVKSNHISSLGWRLQNELRWFSIPQIFTVKTRCIFLWITFTTLVLIWTFFPMVKVHLVSHFALLHKIASTSFFFEMHSWLNHK